MAELVIAGHKTRGKEVIEILEMLGGNNPDKLIANFDYLGYFIGKETRNIYLFHLQGFDSKNVIIFTLEEFLEKFPYKVGDKVQHKGATSCGSIFEVEKMRWIGTHVEYTVKRLWYNNCYSVVTAEYLQPYKETMDKAVFDANAQCCDIMNHLIKQETMEENLEQITLDIPDGYEFFGIDDNNKVVFTKKQSQYPKNYEECCKILFPNSIELGKVLTSGYNCELLKKLGELLICRDANWKIAGEQMGLGKPWEPKLDNNEKIFYIHTVSKRIYDGEGNEIENQILAFPTTEMRDAFHENFKELIEQCKELL